MWNDIAWISAVAYPGHKGSNSSLALLVAFLPL